MIDRLLSPLKNKANCKSYHACEAFSAISHVIYGSRLRKGFLHIHEEQQQATWDGLRNPQPE